MEAVHRGSAADEDGKGNGAGKDIVYPSCQAGFSRCLVKEKNKKDKGAQDLDLVFGGTTAIGIKLRKELQKPVKVEVEEFLAFPVIEVKGIFGIIAGEPASVSNNIGSVLVVALP